MKLVSQKICPFAQRVSAWLAAKQIACEIDYIDLADKPSWLAKISPTEQVPILITDNGVGLFESHAIVEYLEEVFAPLQPNLSPEQKATERAWSHLASKNYLVQCSAQQGADEKILLERARPLYQVFDRMEQELTKKPFFGGEKRGMVDIAWLPLLHRADIVRRKTDYDFLDGYENLKNWQARLMATDLPKKSVAEDFDEVFERFYLSPLTFLGRLFAPEKIPSTPQTQKTCCG